MGKELVLHQVGFGWAGSGPISVDIDLMLISARCIKSTSSCAETIVRAGPKQLSTPNVIGHSFEMNDGCLQIFGRYGEG